MLLLKFLEGTKRTSETTVDLFTENNSNGVSVQKVLTNDNIGIVT